MYRLWEAFGSQTIQPRGALRTYAYGGGQSQKFSGNPKISLQLQCNPKISAHVIYINLYMNIEYPQTMQIEVRIASIEHRNIDITMFGIKKYHQHSFSFFGPKNITFGNILTQKYRTYLPVCACAEPRGGGDLVVQGDVPVAKFSVSKFAIYYLLGSKILKFTTA